MYVVRDGGGVVWDISIWALAHYELLNEINLCTLSACAARIRRSSDAYRSARAGRISHSYYRRDPSLRDEIIVKTVRQKRRTEARALVAWDRRRGGLQRHRGAETSSLRRGAARATAVSRRGGAQEPYGTARTSSRDSKAQQSTSTSISRRWWEPCFCHLFTTPMTFPTLFWYFPHTRIVSVGVILFALNLQTIIMIFSKFNVVVFACLLYASVPIR